MATRNKTYSKLIALMGNTVEMLDFSRAVSLFYHAMQCCDVPGDVVEFGCNRGHTAKILTAILNKPVWVYDSFEGMPMWSKQDEPPALGPGTLKVSPEDVLENFRRDGLKEPRICQAWFKDILPDNLPKAIAFAHLDGDFYQSTLDALGKVWPLLSPGALCIVDDYRDPMFPGVEQAVGDFLCRLALSEYRLDQPWGTDNNRTTHCVLKKW